MASYRHYLNHIFHTHLDRHKAKSSTKQILHYLDKLNATHTKIDSKTVLACYLTEIFNFEHRMYNGDSLEVVEMLMNKNSTHEEITRKLMKTHNIQNEEYARRNVNKLHNIRQATVFVYYSPLTMALVCDLHCVLMRDLLPYSRRIGSFRTIDVKAKGYWTTYAKHETIERKLLTLLQVTNEQLSKCSKDDVVNTITIASIFLVQFLHIHPFRNGNGRCGRLLFSMILKYMLPVPISLHRHVGMSYEASRTKYLEALIHSQHGCALDYDVFIDYVLASIRSFLYDLYTIYVL